jgi:hypothetical protein
MTQGPDGPEAWELLQIEAITIVREAQGQGVDLRVVGSAGIRLHCDAPGPIMDRLNRPAKDIDLVVMREHRKGMRRLLESRGYEVNRDLLVAMEGMRYTFNHPEHGTEIDVFVDRLNFCHTIEVRDRLHRHPITIPLEELLLQKLQIIEMTVTDQMDVGVILATHDVRDDYDDAEALNANYIGGLLARDWGFHNTATRNLEQMKRSILLPASAGMGTSAIAKAEEGIERLLKAVNAKPKTMAWKMRDKIGERMQWWQDVDEKEETY